MNIRQLVLNLYRFERISRALWTDLRLFTEDGAADRTLKPDRCILGGIESLAAGTASVDDLLTASDVDGWESLSYPSGETHRFTDRIGGRISNEFSAINSLQPICTK